MDEHKFDPVLGSAPGRMHTVYDAHTSVIGVAALSSTGNSVLRVGRLNADRTSWSQTEHVVLGPAERDRLLRVLAEHRAAERVTWEEISARTGMTVEDLDHLAALIGTLADDGRYTVRTLQLGWEHGTEAVPADHEGDVLTWEQASGATGETVKDLMRLPLLRTSLADGRPTRATLDLLADLAATEGAQAAAVARRAAVARALWERFGEDRTTGWRELSNTGRTKWLADADAVLAAEPDVADLGEAEPAVGTFAMIQPAGGS